MNSMDHSHVTSHTCQCKVAFVLLLVNICICPCGHWTLGDACNRMRVGEHASGTCPQVSTGVLNENSNQPNSLSAHTHTDTGAQMHHDYGHVLHSWFMGNGPNYSWSCCFARKKSWSMLLGFGCADCAMGCHDWNDSQATVNGVVFCATGSNPQAKRNVENETRQWNVFVYTLLYPCNVEPGYSAVNLVLRNMCATFLQNAILICVTPYPPLQNVVLRLPA